LLPLQDRPLLERSTLFRNPVCRGIRNALQSLGHSSCSGLACKSICLRW